MTRFLLSLTLMILMCSQTIFPQIATGEWAALQSYSNPTLVETYGNLTYCLSEGNLYSFDSSDNSLSTYNKLNKLNDTKVRWIKYAEEFNTLVITYDNGNIDLLVNDDDCYNIPYLKDATNIQSKNVIDIYIYDENAYITGDFGICIVNLEKKEIVNTYNLKTNVWSCAIENNRIYAAGQDGLYIGDMGKNLLDPNNWHKASENQYYKMLSFNGKTYGTNSNGLFEIKEDGSGVNVSTENIHFSSSNENNIIFGRNNILFFYDKEGKITSISKDANFNDVKYNRQKNLYWCACGDRLVNAFKLENNSLTPAYSSIAPDGPRRELYYYMNFFDGQLMIAGGKLETPEVFNPGTVMRYADGKWSYLEENLSQYTGTNYNNTTSIAIDPRDKSHIFVSSSFGGLYEFRNDKFVNLYTYYADESKKNSTLQSILPNEPEPRWYVRVDGLNYDSNNNLWMTNNSSNTIINVLKSDGQWKAFNHPEIAGVSNAEEMIFDQRGNIWLAMRRGKTGIFCFDYNNTVDDTSDDRTRYISNYINQDGESLGELKTYDIVEDKNGSIWIATEKGPLIINNPSRIFDEDQFYVTQIKVPRNDGTNLADYLLKDECITVIAVDGGNRKWLGTQNSGLYLLSEDGLETIHHFDTSNSPLFSDYIESLAINPETGELYIGTDKGLLCYRTDSSEPEDAFAEEAVYAFPNPVKPDFEGVITVTGLVYDTDVKITDVSGKVMTSGKSVGGTFCWDGCNSFGKKVPTGIYFVLAADQEGKEGIVTKVTVIR